MQYCSTRYFPSTGHSISFQKTAVQLKLYQGSLKLCGNANASLEIKRRAASCRMVQRQVSYGKIQFMAYSSEYLPNEAR